MFNIGYPVYIIFIVVGMIVTADIPTTGLSTSNSLSLSLII
jgi:hypothetical protein